MGKFLTKVKGLKLRIAEPKVAESCKLRCLKLPYLRQASIALQCES